ncbi:serpin family protein [Spirulina sp. 06S082]|uniref:serpin family protein n=1 Tax=Spirulina sp. 06S082 TaxID=3110248 RepID=UPI002B1F47E9|nr:serpin family protein [Spirulina sp. 06S082]MEA5472027.1 serpin family protein [Spirulina sp. 06S082]
MLFSILGFDKQGLAYSPCCLEKNEKSAKSDRKSLFDLGIGKDAEKVVQDNTTFAVDLYQQLRNQEGNLFFSPFSTSAALAMTYGGARSTTATEMANVLHFNLPSEQFHAGFADILQNFENYFSETLKIANRIWVQKDYSLLDDFVALTRDRYQAPLAQLDLQNQPESSRQTINHWVSQKTNEKIQEAISEGIINSLTRLVLTNVIHFKGLWASSFATENTQERPFQIDRDRWIDIPMMYHERVFANYKEYPDLQVIELFYRNSPITMIILLPREFGGLIQLEEQVTVDNLRQWFLDLEDSESASIEVFLPRFKMESDLLLKETLIEMGMPQAFGSQSDFSGINGDKSLYIQEVVHKAFIDVNERGTEAGASTSVIVGTRGITERHQFKADRPFLFLLVDKFSNSILFMGRVTNPLE